MAGASVPAHAAQPLAIGEAIPPEQLRAFADDFIGKAMTADHIAGVTVAVVQQGRVLMVRGHGVASLSPRREVDGDRTLFQIGSVTKTFTWVLLMRQVEAGRIGLDDPVNDHLPASLRIPDEGFKNPIRVRDLMTHQPGFEDSTLGHLFVRDPARVQPLPVYLRKRRPRRVREPGVLSSYSNYGVGLAGAMLEHVTGQSWQALIERELEQPLALTHLTSREDYPARSDLPEPMPTALAAELSDSFRSTPAGPAPQPREYMTHIAPAGVISASAGAMARYMLMLLGEGELEGVTILGRDAAGVFRRPMTGHAPEVGNWAGGFMDRVIRPHDLHVYGHDGSTLNQHASMVLIPALDLGVFIAANSSSGHRVTNQFAKRLLEHFYTDGKPAPQGSPALLAEASLYRGEYIRTRRAYTGLEGFVYSLVGSPVDVAQEGYLVLGGSWLAPRDQGVFAAIDGGGFGAQVHVHEGRVARIDTLPFALEPLPFWARPSTFQGLFVLTTLTAFTVFLRWPVRRRKTLAQTASQSCARLIRFGTATSWLLAFVFLGIWIARAASDWTYGLLHWPSPFIIVGSALALLAALGSAALLFLLPTVLRSGTGGWTRWRRLRFLCSVLVFAVCGVIFALKGALQPWAS